MVKEVIVIIILVFIVVMGVKKIVVKKLPDWVGKTGQSYIDWKNEKELNTKE